LVVQPMSSLSKYLEARLSGEVDARQQLEACDTRCSTDLKSWAAVVGSRLGCHLLLPEYFFVWSVYAPTSSPRERFRLGFAADYPHVDFGSGSVLQMVGGGEMRLEGCPAVLATELAER